MLQLTNDELKLIAKALKGRRNCLTNMLDDFSKDPYGKDDEFLIDVINNEINKNTTLTKKIQEEIKK